ncbi:MAG: non-homologous end-joining DNA ligase [Actinomycetota bacterium]|nr:non-homologous end-joining DNA ligase [Actinomycetota bacterium]
MGKRLDKYKSKRDFGQTSEPIGGETAEVGGRFVIQQHAARRLHWDLRLEREGVLASWALPRGVPGHPDENRLAVRTEDHPLEYLEFHGEIPKGSYGAGTMDIWDRGTYACEKFRENEVIVVLEGERVQGRYALIHTRGKDWLIHRMDPPADPAAEPMPDRIEPMKARTAKLPRDDDGFGYEIKWDGVRAVVHLDAGHVEAFGRSGADFTPRYPELRELARAVGAQRMILDGELVAFDQNGRPSFQGLQSRMHLASDSAVKRKMRQVPVTYVIFDLLWLGGHSTLSLSYVERRRLLQSLELEGASWRTPAYRAGDGAALLEASAAQGLEGIMAKRLDCPYEPGRRASGWIKVKNVASQEFVVGGWTPGEGGRGGRLGALCIGVHTEDGRLVYAGKVGTGFTEATLGQVKRELEPLRRDTSPFEGRQPPKGTVFVEPELVAHVEFREWTQAGTLRAPSFKGLRNDVDPAEVVREPQVPARQGG